ncbi:MAG: geranylgeranylglycerol-phosphate geranylgeranyltransferase [Cellulophaga sp.]|uniref:geranylgeranylglycerol-phosphate geranylgeranyltransferase n=1 Tax=unclassified Cellulophaga TaxID=2634405 RepID=UPI0026E1A9B8|nr:MULTISPECIES: geranylgeranylglycerol-phosphate geranylgeranyltransferase [unclassified Cellulophaga]MDO6491802.1 geranylgeranylglycerol-phosphate geranylgeranyltransferase [Cellulophaga sp. 2_MG-2023]MDO6495543.1 geranylgeranylglycerol-phosphate geranylgeranyltransferase [Cellulophaga sp. 3_MG-2023]
MLNRKNKHLVLKFLSLFSVVRGYNILVIALAQYLASIYILAPNLPLRRVVFDLNLFIIVLVSAMVIASGYIINNFYDSEKDLINKPKKTMLDRLVSQRTKLTTYFVLNFLAVFFASYVSFKAVLFFSSYIFGIWYYSHKLKKIPFLGNFVSATLAITPFFVVFVYYKNFETVIFVHAIFLFLLILAREMIKDLENIAGDLAQNYKTIPVIYGAKTSKIAITILIVSSLVPSLLLIYNFDVGHMHYYFKLAVLLLVIFLIFLWKSDTKKQYNTLHNILKFVIISGVFSILLVDINLVLNRIL